MHQDNIEAGGMDLKVADAIKIETVKPSMANEEMQALNQFMEEKEPYLNPRLTLAGLAQMRQLQSGILSKMINKEAGMNFNDYVNSFRVKRVQNAIAEGKADSYSLLAIAFESGFNSKATFNRTFKKLTGQAPSEFVQNSRK